MAGFVFGWVLVVDDPSHWLFVVLLWLIATSVSYLLIRLLGWVVDGVRGA